MATAQEWSFGFARQADADFDRYSKLEAADPASDTVAECHKLQFLQMACEKLVKAHLCGTGTDPAKVQTSHAYVAGTLPVVLRQHAAAVNFCGKSAKEVLKQAKRLAQEIEVLAPAVRRDGGRPDNCEYPWEDDKGILHVPLDWSFNSAALIEARGGRTFLKLIRGAIDSLLRSERDLS